jgi:dihydroorotase-like cyclic amidohydrolase
VELAAELKKDSSVYVETCPQYLLLLESELLVEGPLRKFTPPARARSTSELETMWTFLRTGLIDYVSSDHAPSTRAAKAEGGVWEAPFGLPGIDTTFPVMLDAALRGRLSLEQLVRLYSTAPARIHRLFPRKGNLGIGADADLVIVDPGMNRLIDSRTVLSKAGWSPFAGRSVRGGVVGVVLRGQVVLDRGAVDDRLLGRFLPGPGYCEPRQ